MMMWSYRHLQVFNPNHLVGVEEKVACPNRASNRSKLFLFIVSLFSYGALVMVLSAHWHTVGISLALEDREHVYGKPHR